MRKRKANRKRMLEELGKRFADLLHDTPTDELYRVYPALYDALIKEKIIKDIEEEIIPLF